MTELFDSLSRAIAGAPVIALAAAAAWGVLSILLSPCHLASIPLVVGFIDDQGAREKRRAFILSALFALGILITIAAIGTATSAAGRMMGDIGRSGNYLVAAIFFIVGLHLLEILRLPFLGAANHPKTGKKGAGAAFSIGLIFGVALGPCTFAYMAPMLAVVLNIASSSPIVAGSLIVSYAVGHCAVIVLAGTFAGMVQKYLDWNERSSGALILKKICGALVILGGFYLIWSVH